MERFWAKVSKDDNSGCWNWTAYKNPNGYGQFWFLGRDRLAHRVSFELMVGPIPSGKEIDHQCRNRACVNPKHLEAVTRKVNVIRGESNGAINSRKTHCPKGHEYTAVNTYFRAARNQRECRRCHADRAMKFREGRASF